MRGTNVGSTHSLRTNVMQVIGLMRESHETETRGKIRVEPD
jgi:hypothetical protein